MDGLRRWAQTLTLIAFGVLLALVIGGATLVLTGSGDAVATLFDPCEPADPYWIALATTLTVDYRTPCARFFWDEAPGAEFYHLIRLNNFGLHDRNLSLEKPRETFRVLILGDSFPQGWQVPLEKGFPRLLEDALNRDSRRPIEVINMSVDTFGTDRQLLLYAALGAQFKPDLVLLSFYAGNDVMDNSLALTALRNSFPSGRPFFTLGADGDLRLHNAPPLDPTTHLSSAPWRWLADLTQAQTPAPPFEMPPRPRVIARSPYTLEYPVELGLYLPDDPAWAEAWALTEALLLRLRALVNGDGIPFGVLIIPDRRVVHSVHWDETVHFFPFLRGVDPLAPVDRVEGLLTEAGVPVLNLAYALRGWALGHPGERLYYPGDGHLNANGHAVIAQRVGFWLDEMRLIP